ncbi:MAG: hypothetical protein WKG01_19200 [Kofleriaceae bacterium]
MPLHVEDLDEADDEDIEDAFGENDYEERRRRRRGGKGGRAKGGGQTVLDAIAGAYAAAKL